MTIASFHLQVCSGGDPSPLSPLALLRDVATLRGAMSRDSERFIYWFIWA